MRDQRLKKLAHLLVHYSTKVQPGELVFISCDEVSLPWMVEVSEAAIKAGAYVETHLSSELVKEVMLTTASEEQLLKGSIIKEVMLDKADVWLTAWGSRNTRFSSAIDGEKNKLALQGEQKWREIYRRRMGDKSLRWCGTQFPTHAYAQEAGMSLRAYEDFVFSAALLDHDDPVAAWQKVSVSQQKWADYLSTKETLRIVSKDTDISMSIKGRSWENCDGKLNMPDGEICTAPVENSVEGHIRFSFPGLYIGTEVEDIFLEVKEGKVVKASAAKGEQLLLELLKTDEGASYFGEVAIGTNYGIPGFTRNMLFDEKLGGTIHMAIGASLQMCGGKNQSSLHWDLLCDMKKEGRIYADGELFYEKGTFLD